MRALVWCTIALLAGGCASSDPCDGLFGACVALTVGGSGSIDTLRFSLSGAANANRVAPPLQTLTPLPVYVALQLAHADSGGSAPFAGGDVRIDVEGQRAGMIVGTASTHVTLGVSDHVKASLTLASGPLPAGDDLAGAAPNDLALACSAADMALFASDPHNCGSCGHDCLGGACNNGLCQPIVVATTSTGTNGIAVDANNLYLSRGSPAVILRQSLGGGAPATIFMTTTSPIYGIALAGQQLLVNDSGLHIKTLPVPGGGASLTAGYDGTIVGLGADAGHVYFAGTDNIARSVALPLSTNASVVGTLPQTPTAFASDGTTLYFATPSGIGGIPLPSGSAINLASISSVQGLAVDGSTLFATTGPGSVVRLTRNGNALTVSGTIATGQSTPGAVAVDATAVYWVDQNDGTVMRVAR